MNEKWTQEITVDDMPTKDMRLVAECCGVDVAVKLMQEMGGISVYVSGDLGGLKTKYIRKKYDGTRDCANRLAIECGVSINYIYKILKPNVDDNSDRKQLGLFD